MTIAEAFLKFVSGAVHYLPRLCVVNVHVSPSHPMCDARVPDQNGTCLRYTFLFRNSQYSSHPSLSPQVTKANTQRREHMSNLVRGAHIMLWNLDELMTSLLFFTLRDRPVS